jgi:hypothetical protein
MPCGTTRGMAITTPNSSSRLTAGAISSVGVDATIADPAAEQIGQTCESSDWELRSRQQCNCAPKSRLARITASSRVSLDRLSILPGFSPVSSYTRPALKRHRVTNPCSLEQTPVCNAANSKDLAIQLRRNGDITWEASAPVHNLGAPRKGARLGVMVVYPLVRRAPGRIRCPDSLSCSQRTSLEMVCIGKNSFRAWLRISKNPYFL